MVSNNVFTTLTAEELGVAIRADREKCCTVLKVPMTHTNCKNRFYDIFVHKNPGFGEGLHIKACK